MRYLRLLSFLALVSVCSAREKPRQHDPSVPEPTLSEVRYGEHERHVLDFWRAESDGPTPLVFSIHGGGWLEGSKERLRTIDVERLLNNGISVVAINYRLMSHVGDEMPPVRVPVYDAARALQFVRSKAAEWNIDKEKIAATGGSAGACSSLWIAYHEDLADPSSEDPIARESTSLYCLALVDAQTSLDPKQMKEWIPNCRYGGHAFGIDGGFEKFLEAREEILPWIKEYSPYELLTENAPPTYIQYGARGEKGVDQKDPTHSGNFGELLKEKADALGVECIIEYRSDPDREFGSPMDFLLRKLKGE